MPDRLAASGESSLPRTEMPPPPHCPACDGAAWSERRSWTSLRECLQCGVVLNDRSATRLEEEARYRHPLRPVERGGAERARRRWRLAERIAAEPGRGLRAVLDVGCGSGEFLRVAREGGVRTAGIEIDPRAAASARAAGIPIAERSFHDVAVPEVPWDLVTFWDVLDQVEDPGGALRAVLPGLGAGGVLLIRGRNGRLHATLKRVALRARRHLPGLPDPTVVHRWGFGAAAWRAILERAGLDDVRCRAAAPMPISLSPSLLAFGRKRAAR